jgi:hypothetical protein
MNGDTLIYNLTDVTNPQNTGSAITFGNRNTIYYSNVESEEGQFF